jgi:hypothetical protein
MVLLLYGVVVVVWCCSCMVLCCCYVTFQPFILKKKETIKAPISWNSSGAQPTITTGPLLLAVVFCLCNNAFNFEITTSAKIKEFFSECRFKW